MTRDDIKALMQEAGLKAPAKGDFIFIHWDQIALLIQHEREACAQTVEDYDETDAAVTGRQVLAMEIRARGQR